MPELPEVETVKRVIEPQIKGKKIIDVVIENSMVVKYPSCEKFTEMMKEMEIKGMFRRGKFLGIYLDNNKYIIIHFRMTGSLLVTKENYPKEKHTHVVIKLEDGNEIRYIDTRRFGGLWLLGQEKDTYTGMDKLGIEPSNSILTGEYLKEKLGNRKQPIKKCLLDQGVIAGIGNIYGDEILFEASINPNTKASELSMDQWIRLASTIPEVIDYFIEKNHISKEDYILTKGREYRNTPYLRAYGHQGKPCINCGTIMKKIVISGRSSVYCPNCQQ